MRHKEQIDLSVDPPPDLAIEVDLSSSSVDKEDVYAGLKVPELWRYEEGQIQVTILQQGRYTPIESSPALPGLPVGELMRFVDMRRALGETQLLAAFQDWVQQSLAPQH